MKVNIEDVIQARAGNRESFELVYTAVAPDLYKVALYTLGNSHDAEDVVSETFLEAYKGIRNLRDENSFRPWIMKILSVRCKRKISDYIKGKGQLDIDELLDLSTGSDGQTERTEVLTAMEMLTPEERTIVVLSVLQGYTIREIAQILSCPQGTVSSKLHRTLKKLRTMLS